MRTARMLGRVNVGGDVTCPANASSELQMNANATREPLAPDSGFNVWSLRYARETVDSESSLPCPFIRMRFTDT